MAKKAIGKLWTDTQIQLSRLITSETAAPKGFDSERQANDYVRRLFVRYNEILRKLDDIYGTLVHPQKRRILRILLDGLVGRLVELKRELIRFDSCEYTYFEDLALDQNKTLDDLAIEIPRYFAPDRSRAMQERNRTIQTILDRLNQSRNPLNTASASDLSSSSDNPITLAMAVRMLQAHERARQGRAHAFLMHRTEKESKMGESYPTDEKQLNEGCLVIQTIWRQKHAEKLFHAKKLEESQLLGMMILPARQTSTANTIGHDQHRLDLQQQYQEEFDGAAASVKEKIRQCESIDTKARMEQVLHQWLLESRQLYGHFPVYPSDDMHGSAVLFKEMTIGEVQQFVQKQAQAMKKSKSKPKDEKKPVKKPAKKAMKQKSIPNELHASKFLPIINDQVGVYKDLFYGRDESHNVEQRYDMLLAIEQYRPEVEEELRHDVDEILRKELIYLKLAVDNSEDPPMKKNKKRKNKKKKRKKKTKDLVANRTNDSIFEELVETGIILPTRAVRQQDFIGDYQYLSETLRQNEKEPMPSLLDCQQLVTLQIVFPLCSKDVHLHLPPHRAVLLAGPRGSGKELLVHIACNELGGLLLDLSPSNLINSFNSAEGLKILFAMIKRLVASMAPVLCIIHDAELFFAKKLTADEKQLEVARHKRLMRRFIKKIQPGERLMFIGLTSQPYRARVKPLLQIYQFIILFPKPNYGSRRKLLQTFLTENHQMLIDDIELSVLASISKGYTAGQLLDTAEKVIGLKRSQKYPNNICSAQDFLSILGLQTPIFLDEEKKIKAWYERTPNGAKRLTELNQPSGKSAKSSARKAR